MNRTIADFFFRMVSVSKNAAKVLDGGGVDDDFVDVVDTPAAKKLYSSCQERLSSSDCYETGGMNCVHCEACGTLLFCVK